MTKYEEYYKRMIDENPEAFEAFNKIHEDYSKDASLQDQYNEIGKPIIELIRDYEDKLCNRSEGSGYAHYSGNLAEKFWERIRKDYPLIDRVGVVIKQVQVEPANEEEDSEVFEINKIEMFSLKKINL